MPVQKQVSCCRRQVVGGHEQLIIDTTGGQRITLSDGGGSIHIEDTSGNAIQMDNGKVTVKTPGTLVLQAAQIEINGSAVTINAGAIQCSGTVQADTVIANSVVAASYSPGAGNLW